MKVLLFLLAFALPVSAQNFANDEVAANPARFRQITWEHTFTIGVDDDFTTNKGRDTDLLFPSSISTYRVPSCEVTEAKTGEPFRPSKWEVSRSIVTMRGRKGEQVHIHCLGYELKPWRRNEPATPRNGPYEPGERVTPRA